MNKKINIKSFILGVCVALTLTSIISVSAQNIDVIMNGIKIYWDGVEKILTDANGNKVEPMIYQGTTYVPLRAMSNLMGKEVDWNQSEMAVYVGTKPTMRTIPLADMAENINDGDEHYKKNFTFKLKNKEIKCDDGLYLDTGRLTHWYGSDYRTHSVIYVLEGKYSAFTAKVVMPYDNVGADKTGILTFYSVENDGTENKIQSYDLKQTDDPIEFNINLTGITNLKIEAQSEPMVPVVIYDAYFLGE